MSEMKNPQAICPKCGHGPNKVARNMMSTATCKGCGYSWHNAYMVTTVEEAEMDRIERVPVVKPRVGNRCSWFIPNPGAVRMCQTCDCVLGDHADAVRERWAKTVKLILIHYREPVEEPGNTYPDHPSPSVTIPVADYGHLTAIKGWAMAVAGNDVLPGHVEASAKQLGLI